MAQKAFERQKSKVKALERLLTPLEVAKLLNDDVDLPFAIAPLLKSGQRPAAYIRETWSEDATYFAGRSGADRLLVVFSAQKSLPLSYFLQALRDDVYDVVMLHDPNGVHYTQGVRGLGSFLESTRRIEDFADTKGYRQIVTYGVSRGGFPALRAGRLLKAKRAISVGGLYPWHAGRLARAEQLVDAFDLLCPCAPPSPTALVAVYALRNAEDKSAFDLLQKTFPECVGVPIDTAKHNLIGYFYTPHLFPVFLACLLDYWDLPEIRTDLLKRLDQAVQESRGWQSPPTAPQAEVSNAPRNRRSQQVGEWLRAVPLQALALRRVLRSAGRWPRKRS